MDISNELKRLGCTILSFRNKEDIGTNPLIYKVGGGLSFLYMLANMDINSIEYTKDGETFEISIGDTVNSYHGRITHEVARFRIGFDGITYYAKDEFSKHEMSIKNITKKV